MYKGMTSSNIHTPLKLESLDGPSTPCGKLRPSGVRVGLDVRLFAASPMLVLDAFRADHAEFVGVDENTLHHTRLWLAGV
jgi:hypothetical protein